MSLPFEYVQLTSSRLNLLLLAGSLPPSPADSGVSDVESSSSGAGSAEELKARLQPPPPAPFHTPFLPFYPHHQIASTLQQHAAAHPRPPGE